MTVPSHDHLSGHMARVAKALLGAPNQSLSKQGKEWRYGTHGSLAIDLHKGTYFDFETNEGGGVLDLIKREKGLTGGAAIDFMRQIGCDLSPLSRNGIAAVSNRRLVATFDYTYATGKLASSPSVWESGSSRGGQTGMAVGDFVVGLPCHTACGKLSKL
jgi:hypothetical protein